ncbi:MAG: hypothetical protein V3U60_05180 [Gammaproteobacteria bacterium]
MTNVARLNRGHMATGLAGSCHTIVTGRTGAGRHIGVIKKRWNPSPGAMTSVTGGIGRDMVDRLAGSGYAIVTLGTAPRQCECMTKGRREPSPHGVTNIALSSSYDVVAGLTVGHESIVTAVT